MSIYKQALKGLKKAWQKNSLRSLNYRKNQNLSMSDYEKKEYEKLINLGLSKECK